LRQLFFLLIWVTNLNAQAVWFAGGGPGLAQLSAGAASRNQEPGGAAVSFYEAAPGPLVHGFGGAHLNNYLSFQGTYHWNRNDVTFTESVTGPRPVFGERSITVSQHQVSGDLLVYFRDTASWVRPYLGVGLAVTRFTGTPSTRAGLRAAAGIDFVHKSGWGFRYSFLETISGNPVGEAMRPPSTKRLMTFQNLFGVVRYFGR
jgi:hypothetical protein